MSTDILSVFSKDQVLTPTDGQPYEEAISRWADNAIRRAQFVVFPRTAQEVGKAVRCPIIFFATRTHSAPCFLIDTLRCRQQPGACHQMWRTLHLWSLFFEWPCHRPQQTLCHRLRRRREASDFCWRRCSVGYRRQRGGKVRASHCRRNRQSHRSACRSICVLLITVMLT